VTAAARRGHREITDGSKDHAVADGNRFFDDQPLLCSESERFA
jgi:hypothetical protein